SISASVHWSCARATPPLIIDVRVPILREVPATAEWRSNPLQVFFWKPAPEIVVREGARSEWNVPHSSNRLRPIDKAVERVDGKVVAMLSLEIHQPFTHAGARDFRAPSDEYVPHRTVDSRHQPVCGLMVTRDPALPLPNLTNRSHESCGRVAVCLEQPPCRRLKLHEVPLSAVTTRIPVGKVHAVVRTKADFVIERSAEPKEPVPEVHVRGEERVH